MEVIIRMIRILFVCLGNICRSPMAEAVFRDLVNKENLADKIEVDSAGTSEWHIKKPPHKGTRRILDEKGISYDGMKARQVNSNDWNTFNYIIAMDEQNINDLKQIAKHDQDGVVIAKLMDYVEEPEEINVPDPYFTGDFNYTYKLVLEGATNLLEHIKTTHDI